jgi:hypothetical protein
VWAKSSAWLDRSGRKHGGAGIQLNERSTACITADRGGNGFALA